MPSEQGLGVALDRPYRLSADVGGPRRRSRPSCCRSACASAVTNQPLGRPARLHALPSAAYQLALAPTYDVSSYLSADARDLPAGAVPHADHDGCRLLRGSTAAGDAGERLRVLGHATATSVSSQAR